jgi:hypothetical protein
MVRELIKMNWSHAFFSFLANLFSRLSYKLASSRFLSGQKSHASFTASEPDSFGIVIVTFEARQFTRAIPLLKQIRASGVMAPISLIINGNFTGSFDAELRRKLLLELSEIPKVFPLFIRKFHGLSHNWNLGIRLLGCDTALVLNDDLWIDQGSFKSEISRITDKSAEHALVTINRSFSHFLIRESALFHVGWFDERFFGIGEEDGDYYLRYTKVFSKTPLDIQTNSIVHFNDIDSGTERKGVAKYSLANLVFARFKYGEPLDGNEGQFGEFRTPNFDPSYRLLSEDFRRAVGAWEDLSEEEFLKRISNLLNPSVSRTTSKELKEAE